MNIKLTAAQIVEAVLLGVIVTREEYQRRISELDIDPNSPLASDLHQVGHYLDDLDIRQRDMAYAEDQTKALAEILSRLRA